MHGVDLSKYSQLLTAYTELRVQENRSVQISFVKGNNTINSRSITGGVSARVYKNGSWGFASNPEVTDDSIRSVIKVATDNAVFLDSRERKGKKPLPVTAASSDNDFSTKKSRLGQRQLVEFAREVDSHIVRKYPNLSSRTVVLSCLDMEKTLLTSDGSYAHSMIPRSFIHVTLSVEKDGKPVELSDSYGGLGQFEDVFESPASIFDGIEKQYQHLMKKKEGVFPEAGVKTCVLDAELAGILAHEAIGHTTEADLVMGGSVAGGLLGKEVASPLITLVDFANTCLGKTCPVPVYVDDEGTRAEDVVIIDKGVLKGFMHNKESAAHFGVSPTGNARAFLFSDEPLIRMRNTAIMPGTSKLEDMIASVDDGYYLINPSNGQADSTSEFMFGITLGYEIKNGKIGRAIVDTTISGVAFDVLKTVTMVSDEMKWLSAGMCGKKQPIPVGMGGPAIKCKVNIGGR
ncbi:MAG: TldD/PmbA family protein [Candidatus Fermentithermobacillus carboniphilus]|uniref:TldD/PmbA family protein n=1 Tax=Candidatus Fermentithermobacillus carboniphilus TaxID=3085328 RepID=A0AAT9LEA8_9FIRM|nr:MAG: TldD/PmbA family protein [Candidatus Fermentithermobacillus carboniphilus]